jgi:hypothetical protein
VGADDRRRHRLQRGPNIDLSYWASDHPILAIAAAAVAFLAVVVLLSQLVL